jgi:hypothetical protein
MTQHCSRTMAHPDPIRPGFLSRRRDTSARIKYRIRFSHSKIHSMANKAELEHLHVSRPHNLLRRNYGWTIMSGTWNHLRQRKCGTEEYLMSFIKKEAEYQGKIEAAGYCSPTWRLQRALRDLLNATYLQGESAVTAPPLFDGAGRGASLF